MNTQPKKTEKTLAVAGKRPGAVALLKDALTAADNAFKAVAALLSRNLAPGTLAAVYHVVDKSWIKVLEDHKAEAREVLLDLVKKEGQPNDNGHKVMDVDWHGDSYRCERREVWSKLPDAGNFSALLTVAGLSITDGCNQVISYEPDQAKIDSLIEHGKLKASDVEKCRKLKSTQLHVTKL